MIYMVAVLNCSEHVPIVHDPIYSSTYVVLPAPFCPLHATHQEICN